MYTSGQQTLQQLQAAAAKSATSNSTAVSSQSLQGLFTLTHSQFIVNVKSMDS